MTTKERCRKAALEYLKTPSNGNFKVILNLYEGYIHKTVHSKSRMLIDKGLYGHEDLFQEGSISLWRHLNKYKYICSECTYETKSRIKYVIHTKKHHDGWIDPEIDINKFLNFNIGAYIGNAVKKSYSKSSKLNTYALRDSDVDKDHEVSSIFDVIEDIENSIDKFNEQIVINELVEKSKYLLNSSAKKVLELLEKGYSVEKISFIFYKKLSTTDDRFSTIEKSENYVNNIIDFEIKEKMNGILKDKDFKCKCGLICLTFKSLKVHYDKRHKKQIKEVS